MVRVGDYAIRSDNGLSWQVGRPEVASEEGREYTRLKSPRYFHSMEAALQDVRRRTLHDEVVMRGELNLEELMSVIEMVGRLGG